MAIDAGVSTFLALLGLQLWFAAACALLFELLRRLLPAFYAARTTLPTALHSAAKEPRHAPFGWVPQVWSYADSEIVQVAGMDALAFLRMQKFGLELFMGIFLIVGVTTIPVNLSGTNVSDAILAGGTLDPAAGLFDLGVPPPVGPAPSPPPAPCPDGLICYSALPAPTTNYLYTSLDMVTMTNVTPGSSVLWVHWMITLIVVSYFLLLLRKYNLKAMSSRLDYLQTTQPKQRPVMARTLLLTDIPGVPWNTFLDRIVRAAEGPLAFVTPKSVADNLERKLAEDFWLGSGTSLVRSEKGKSMLEGASPGKFKPTESFMARRQAKAVINEEAGASVHDLEGMRALEESVSSWTSSRRTLQEGTSVEEMIRAELERCYGAGSVICVHVMASHKVLRHWDGRYRKTKKRVQALVERYSARIQRREEHIPLEKRIVFGPAFGDWGKTTFGTQPVIVESLKFNTMMLKELKLLVESHKLDAEVMVEPTGFVTFRDQKTASIVGTSMFHHDTSSWLFHSAPAAEDVLWSNLGLRRWERRIRGIAVFAMFSAACVFYVIPVAFLQSLLVENNPYLTAVESTTPILGGFVVAILPTVILQLILMIMPPLLELTSSWRGVVAVSFTHWETVNLYFAFKVVVVFFGSIISGTVILNTVLGSIFYEPIAVLELLGAAAPSQSYFFITYVATQALVIRPVLSLINIIHLSKYMIKSERAQTEAEVERASLGINPVYGYEIPSFTLSFLLGMVFCVQNPLMPAFMALFFGVAGTICRYNWVHVFGQQFQGGGLVWNNMVDHMMTALMLFLVFMSGYFQVLNANVQSYLLVPVVLLVGLYWSIAKRQLSLPSDYLSVSQSATVDENFGPLEVTAEVCDTYNPHFMKDDEVHLAELIAASERVQAALAGDAEAAKDILAEASFGEEKTKETA